MDRRRVLPLVFLCFVALVVFSPVLFGGRTMYPTDVTNELFLPFAAEHPTPRVQATSLIDCVLYYYPARVFQAASFRAGHLNLWNPNIFGGHPAFASSAGIASLDPFNVLLLLPNLGAALAWRSFLQELACLIFMYLYLRHLQLGAPAAVIGSLGYGLNSMFWVNIFDWSIGGMLWLPLVCLLIDRALAMPSRRSISLAGLVLGVALLSSAIQIYFYLCLAVAGVAGLQWWFTGRDHMPFTPLVRTLALVFLLAVGLSAIQLVPTLELLSHSRRFAVGPLEATHKLGRSFRDIAAATAGLASFVFPNLAGRMKDSLQISGALWGGELHWQGFIGVVPFILAVVGAVAGADRRRVPYVVLGLLVVGLIVYTPASLVLYDRGFLLYIFCACVLAGFGMQAIGQSAAGRRARLAAIGLTAFFSVVLLAVVGFNVASRLEGPRMAAAVDARVAGMLATNFLGQSYPDLYRAKAAQFLSDLRLWSPHTLLPLAMAFGGLTIVALRLNGRVGAAKFAVVAVALTAIDLTFMTLTHVPLVNVGMFPFAPSSPVIDRLLADPDRARVISFRAPGEPPVLPLGLSAMYGLRAADGYDDLGPANLSNFIGFDVTACGPETCVTPHGTEAANVKYVLTGPRTRLPNDRFVLEYDREVRLYRSLAVMPRAFWVPSLDRAAEVDDRRSGGGAAVRIVQDQATATTLGVTSHEAGWVVTSDTYYPGWRATLDGIDVDIVRANGVMRAVAVGQGTHTLSFRYQPGSLMYGLFLSSIALVVAMAGLLFDRARAR